MIPLESELVVTGSICSHALCSSMAIYPLGLVLAENRSAALEEAARDSFNTADEAREIAEDIEVRSGPFPVFGV